MPSSHLVLLESAQKRAAKLDAVDITELLRLEPDYGVTNIRNTSKGEITADVYGFLTCQPNAEVGKVHPKAMPVV